MLTEVITKKELTAIAIDNNRGGAESDWLNRIQHGEEELMNDSEVTTEARASEEELTGTAVDLEATTEEEELTIDSEVTTEVRTTEEELTVTVVDLEATTDEEELTVAAVDSDVTTEEIELWTTAGLEAMTDEVRADLEVTTEELRADQHELLMWSQRS